MVSLRNEFTIYDNQGAELGTIRKKIVKLIGEEYWMEKGGVEFMRIYGDFTEHDYRIEVKAFRLRPYIRNGFQYEIKSASQSQVKWIKSSYRRSNRD